MSLSEEIKKYLPKYLTAQGANDLFSEIGQFPSNIDGRMYTSIDLDANEVLQGDCLEAAPSFRFNPLKVELGPVVVISNTCDVDSTNRRYIPLHIGYCPVLKLSRYTQVLRENGIPDNRIEAHVLDIKRQRVTYMFYLPTGQGLKEDCVIFFDRVTSCELSDIASLGKFPNKIFTLSTYGFYLFLIKLSIHFTRVQEAVDRSMK